jgi:hypothetical protein
MQLQNTVSKFYKDSKAAIRRAYANQHNQNDKRNSELGDTKSKPVFAGCLGPHPSQSFCDKLVHGNWNLWLQLLQVEGGRSTTGDRQSSRVKWIAKRLVKAHLKGSGTLHMETWTSLCFEKWWCIGNRNCGSCRNQCPSGSVCSGGSCGAPSALDPLSSTVPCPTHVHMKALLYIKESNAAT